MWPLVEDGYRPHVAFHPEYLVQIQINQGRKEPALPRELRPAGHERAAGLELWQGEERLANGTAGDYCFRGLPRGLYSLKAGGKEWAVLVNGDVAMDLAGKAALQGDWKRIIGIVLILAINLGGIALIIRIWKGRE